MKLADEILKLTEDMWKRYKALDRLSTISGVPFSGSPGSHNTWRTGEYSPDEHQYIRDYQTHVAGKGPKPDDSKVGRRRAEHLRAQVNKPYKRILKNPPEHDKGINPEVVG